MDQLDIFEENYQPEYNQVLLKNANKDTALSDIAPICGWMYETYGEEVEYVQKIARENPNRVWTVVDNNDGWFGIVTGYHWVNRIGYIITKNEWEDDNEEYEID